ncbi:Fic family protein [Cellulomonas septica]|uniref:Fic family protein n=1 Tax=Cellulomonas septica TaxID=285080 RepID=A0ABX1JZE4_9CELL|nr:Fic family protein [Cellulomonas septica]NKY38660.1 Fic family protein [Cellulomonas septica]
MAPFVDQVWTPSVTDGLPRRYTRSGPYRAYAPEALTGRAVVLRASTQALVDEAGELAAAALASVQHAGLGQIGDLLVRSEASASSLIEGYEPTPRAVAVADFVQRGRTPAVIVARNLRAVRESLTRPAATARGVVAEVCDLHALITPGAAGVRQEPVWIGGATPLDAHYNAPPSDRVPGLLDDLDDYLTSHAHSAVVAAAVAHAQFETIHPFTDGNGRAGRILLGIVLSRYGLTPGVALPVSTELFRDRERYYAALDAYRTGDDDTIVAVVADAVCVAAEESVRLSTAVAAWLEVQTKTLDVHLAERSPSGRVRHGATHRIIADLPTSPVLDVASVASSQAVTDNAARAALETLADAGILRRDRKADRTKTVYVAAGLLGLVSTPLPGHRPDDESAGGDGPVVAVEAAGGSTDACGAWLPRAGRACTEPAGHHGQHR